MWRIRRSIKISLQMGGTWICHDEFKSKRQFIGVKTHWLPGKENVQHALVRKEGYADSLLGDKTTRLRWFFWKRLNCLQCFLLPTLCAIFHLIYWMNLIHTHTHTHTYIYIYIYITESIYMEFAWNVFCNF